MSYPEECVVPWSRDLSQWVEEEAMDELTDEVGDGNGSDYSEYSFWSSD